VNDLNINSIPILTATSGKDPQWIIQANKLCKYVDLSAIRLNILSAIDLRIETGEAVAIVGASGSGKSTLLGLLAGLDVASSGDVYLAGECLTRIDEDARARLRANNVGFVFQSFQLLPSLTALENVMLPLELKGDSGVRHRAMELLGRVGLSQRLAHYPNQLSGGEQQRVALARAFVCSPCILFADEPTGNLDSETGAQVIDLLFELNQEQGTTLVLVTHDSALASRCSRIISLNAGRIIDEQGGSNHV